MGIINFQEQNFDELINEGIVLVDFYANWCGPCKMLAPALEELSMKRTNMKIIKVNVDEQPQLASRFGVMSIPTLHLYKDGVLVASKMGFQTFEMLNEWIDEFIV